MRVINKKQVRTALILITTFLMISSSNAQMRQVYLDTFHVDNAISKISFYSPSQGFVAFVDWIGYSSDSGRSFNKIYITGGNTYLNGYNFNIMYHISINGVKAFDAKNIIVYGDYGLIPAILKSTDGGNTFNVVLYSRLDPQVLNTGITDLVFPENNLTGYAVDADRILKTTDAGQTWSVVLTSAGSYFDKIVGVNNNSVIAISTAYSTNKALRTLNGGISWNNLTLPDVSYGKVNAIFFLDANTGWLSISDDANHSYIFKTYNAANSWVLQNNIYATGFGTNEMRFINDSVGFALGYQNLVLKTSDRGAVWEVLPRDNNYAYKYFTHNYLQVISSDQLWAGGGHGFLEMSTNGGGTPLPLATFLIDTVTVSNSIKVNLTNFSRRDYSYQWFKNDTLISNSYSFSYTYNNKNEADTIKLVVFNGKNSDTMIKYQQFYYPDPPVPLTPEITSFSPTSGKTGSIINIYGSNFIDVDSVSFGGMAAKSFSIVSPTNLTAVLDSGASGEVRIVTAHGVAVKSGFVSLTPYITSFEPSYGGPGDYIIIKGGNFYKGKKYILEFGEVKAKSFQIRSDYEIKGYPDEGSSGNITYETDYGKATISGFTYIPAPEITSFTPRSADEGDTVTIIGKNFVGVTSIKFDSLPARSYSVISDTKIKAVVGKGASGKIYVTTSPLGIDSISGFKYTTPVITSFSPSVGGELTEIKILGQNLTGTSIVTFGGVAANSFVVNSDSSITAIVGPGSSGEVFVRSSHGFVSLPGFQFTNNPIINSFSPISGQVGSVVTIYGSNFNANENENIVYFGPVKASVLSSTNSTLKVKVPSGAAYEPLTVTTGGRTASSILKFAVTFPDGRLTENTFIRKTDIVASSLVVDILSVDLDGDGKPDLIAAGLDTLSYFRNISTTDSISFDKRIDFSFLPFSHGLYSKNIRAADINGDGKKDIVFMSGDTICIAKNTSTPGNISFIIYKFGIPYLRSDGFVTGDLNGDGKPDIVVISSTRISIVLNSTQGNNISFLDAYSLPAKTFHHRIGVELSDFDGDGKTDIVVANSHSETGRLENNTAITIFRNTYKDSTLFFEPDISYGLPGSYTGINVGDFDGDGKPDIIYSTQFTFDLSNNLMRPDFTVNILRNNSDPGHISFSNNVFNIGGLYAESGEIALALGDINGDGKPDILGTDLSPYFTALKNQSNPGNVNVGAVLTYLAQYSTYSSKVALNDINGDSRPELIISNFRGNQQTISIFKNEETPIEIQTCEADTVIILSNIGGTSYHWQVDEGSGFVDISDDSTYIGTKARKLKIATIPKSFNGYLYRCVIDSFAGTIYKFVFAEPDSARVILTATYSNICKGTRVTFTANPENGGKNPLYYWEVDGVKVGNQYGVYTTSTLQHTSKISVQMTGSSNCSIGRIASDTFTIEVNEPSPPSVSINASATDICPGTKVTFTAIPVRGGLKPSFQWSVNGNKMGRDSINFTSAELWDKAIVSVSMISNEACTAPKSATSNTITMNVKPLPMAITISGDTSISPNFSNKITSTISPENIALEYQWQDSTGQESWQNMYVIDPKEIMYYPRAGYKLRCIVYSSDACVSNSSAVSNVLTFYLKATSDSTIRFYPNPVHDLLTIDILKDQDEWEKIDITAINGNKVISQKISGTPVKINVSALRKGEYVAVLKGRNKSKAYFRFIKL